MEERGHTGELEWTKWNGERMKENRQEYKEMQCKVERDVMYDELYKRLDTKEEEDTDLYHLERKRDGSGRDVEKVGVIKDRDENVLTS